MFTHAQARRLGVSDRRLYRWRNDGTIDIIGRGIFAQPGLEADFDLIEIAVQAPDAALCLSSALARHGLTDEIPATINIALPRPQRQPRTTAPVTWHRFDEASFGLDRTELAVAPGIIIGLYGRARSVIDAFGLRHLYGHDQATEALRRWLRQHDPNPPSWCAWSAASPPPKPPCARPWRSCCESATHPTNSCSSTPSKGSSTGSPAPSTRTDSS